MGVVIQLFEVIGDGGL